MYVVYSMFFLNDNGNANTINICLILSNRYMFIPVSGCVGKGPSALLCPGAYNAVKTALLLPLPPQLKRVCGLKHHLNIR